MEQRSLRLGDIVDDYCPRERRVTNHAIVALVGNTIRQTRCSTCDAEHEYKEAKMPKKRGKTGAGDASDLAGGVLVTPKSPANGAAAEDGADQDTLDAVAAPEPEAASQNGISEDAPEEGNGQPSSPDSTPHETWFSHRPLIRATLPRTESDPPPARVIPEFTMHQRHGRGFGGRGGFRHGPHSNHSTGNHSFRGGNGNGQPNGNEPDGNRAPQPGRPAGGGGRRRRRRRPR